MSEVFNMNDGKSFNENKKFLGNVSWIDYCLYKGKWSFALRVEKSSLRVIEKIINKISRIRVVENLSLIRLTQ